MHYRESESGTAQTVDISNDGYTSVSVDPATDTQQYDITGLTAFTNYSVQVQAVVTPTLRPGQADLLGEVTSERVNRTHSAPDPDTPTVPPTIAPIDRPTSSRVTYLIPSPLNIDTGRVM